MISYEDSVDVLVIGSGLVGAAFARSIRDVLPGAKILMVDAGPVVGSRAGENLRNLDAAQRVNGEVKSQGPSQAIYAAAVADRFRSLSNSFPTEVAPRPGTFLAHSVGAIVDGLPAAAMSSNVGGMGAHWTCACPTPAASEWPEFIGVTERQQLLARASRLLHVTQNAFNSPSIEDRLLQSLASIYRNAPDRGPQAMPMAVRTDSGARQLVGSDTIFPPIAEGGDTQFMLMAETHCFRLETSGNRVTGAWLRDRQGAAEDRLIRAGVVFVAADSLRTPQLLWASGIRPNPLGKYLNEHARMVGIVPVSQELAGSDVSSRTWPDDPTIGTYWVPFDDDRHPCQVQITLLEADGGAQGAGVGYLAGLSSFVPTEISEDNCVAFAEGETDFFGMPRMHIRFALSDEDQRRVEAAQHDQRQVALALNARASDYQAVRAPAGSSLHYTGTVRMGEDRQTSVCNPASQVWDHENLFVGGNGVIPTSVSVNCTMMSVALACRASDAVVSQLRRAA